MEEYVVCLQAILFLTSIKNVEYITLQPKNKRQFIDKKNAVTFHLVHRSQQDPLIADETAPQHVLLEATTPNLLQSQKNEVK